MTPQQAIETKPAETVGATTETPFFVEAEHLIGRMEEVTKSIAKRAYEFFEARGRQLGNELEDWFRAESEFLRQVPVTMKESETEINVQAEVPGFKADEIKISADPERLIIEGSSMQITEEKSKEEPQKILFSERRSNKFCRSFTLPAEIDPAKVTANLKNGVLEIVLPKAPARQPVGVEVKTI